MLPDTTDMLVLMLWLAWALLSRTSRSMKSSMFEKAFPTELSLKTVTTSAPLTFAAGLMAVIWSPTAPTIDYFKTLTIPTGQVWAVYVLVMERIGHRPKTYCGSGTDSTEGADRRMKTYDARTRGIFSDQISRTVEKALCDGWVITHKGYLVTTPLPRPYFRFLTRGLFLVLESVFSLVFWMMATKKDYCMPHLCPWPVESFTYDGACTHFSINEGGWQGAEEDQRYEGLTPDQADDLDLEYKQAKSRMYIANKGEGVHKANTLRYGLQQLASQTNKCTVCDLDFRSPAKLREHEARPIHLRKAAGIQGRSYSRDIVSQGRYRCNTCDKNLSTAGRLTIHLNGPRHAKQLRTLGLSPALT